MTKCIREVHGQEMTTVILSITAVGFTRPIGNSDMTDNFPSLSKKPILMLSSYLLIIVCICFGGCFKVTFSFLSTAVTVYGR
jgi:hypothetical protein